MPRLSELEIAARHSRENQTLQIVSQNQGELKGRIVARVALKLHISERKAREYLKLFTDADRIHEDQYMGEVYLYTSEAWAVEARRREEEGLAIKRLDMEREAELASRTSMDAFVTESIEK